MENLRVAIVHDRLAGYGNEERVLAALYEIYPRAAFYFGWIDPRLQRILGLKSRSLLRGFPATTLPLDPLAYQTLQFLNQVPVFLSPAQRLWGMPQHSQRYRFFLPYCWEQFDLSGYDLVISSSFMGLSHGVRVPSSTLHLCYCHTPARSLWEQHSHGLASLLDVHLRQYDFYAAQRVDRFLTTSERAARRIYHFYRRSAEVMPPPVQIVGEGHAGERYYLYVGDLRRSLQVDVLIQAFNRVQRPLQLVGSGEDEAALRQLAGPTIHFLGTAANLDLEQVYANATAFIQPTWDIDFDMAALQAMGRGLPVIAYAGSGLKEVVLHYRTGLLIPESTEDALASTILEFEKLRFFSQACIDRAQEFSPSVFRGKLEWFIAQAWEEFCQRRSSPTFA
ncbi:MAG: glycosyltransferase [Prochlorotrichaceae cyanobacterium]|jgi:glycosyltransferase involved in cell wall biosynthesis